MFPGDQSRVGLERRLQALEAQLRNQVVAAQREIVLLRQATKKAIDGAHDPLGPGEVDWDNLAPHIRPPRLVRELPVLPHPDYQVGDLVTLLLPDGTAVLYEAVDLDGDGVADAWLPVLRADAIEGQLSAQQLADHIINGQKVAPGLQIPRIMSELPFERANSIKFGVFTYDGVNSIYGTFEGVRILEELLGTTFWCVHWFGSMGVSIAETKGVFDRINEHGRVPFFSFQSGGVYDNASIIAGTHDAYLTEMAEMIRDTGRVAYIRIFPEMNGSWAPWYPRDAGPQQVVAAWRKVVDVFRAAGADNVKWVWNPNVADDNWDNTLTPPGVNPNWNYRMEDYYPGDDYVDFTGFDTYNRGTRPLNTPSPNFNWLDAKAVFDRAYERQLAIAPDKKMIMGEFGSEEPSSADVAAGRSKEAWVDGLFNDVTAEAYPAIEALVYFDQDKSNPAQAPDDRSGDYDWTIRSSPGSIAAFQRGLAFTRGSPGGDYQSGDLAYVLNDRQLYEFVEGYWWHPVESSILKANSVVAGTIAAAAVGAREIRAGSIAAHHVAVADLDNLARNGDFTAGKSFWFGENPGRDRVVHLGSRVAQNALEIDVLPGWPNNVYLEGRAAVEQGTMFAVSFWARRLGANAPLVARLKLFDSAGEELFPGAVAVTVPPTVTEGELIRYHAVVTAEHESEFIGGVSLQFSVEANASPAGSYQVTNVVWRRAVGGELVVDGSITAEHIRAKSVTTDKLVIGDTTNMVKNPEFWLDGEDGPVASLWGWELEPSEGVWGVELNTASNRVSPAYAVFGLTTYWRHMWTEWEAATAESAYYLSVTAARVGSVNSLEFGVQYETAAGAVVMLKALAEAVTAGSERQIARFAGSVAADSWLVRNGITLRVPADARRVRAVVSVEGRAGTSGHWRVARVELRKAAGGELIVDGAIKADSLAANSVVFGKVAAGAIGTDQLVANSVTAAKVRGNVLQAQWNNLLMNGGAERGVNPAVTYPKAIMDDPNDYNAAGGTFSLGPAGRLGGSAFRYSYVGKDSGSTAYVYFNGFSAAEGVLGVPVAAGDKLHYSGWFRMASGSAIGRDIRMRIYWRTATGAYLDEDVLTVPRPGSGWEQTIHNVTVPPNAVYAFFAVTFTGAVGTTVYEFDDMQARVAYSHVDIADLGAGVTVRPDGVYVSKPDTTLMLKLGDVTGRKTVPPPPEGESRRYGLWGKLGTGVFIEGAPYAAYASSSATVLARWDWAGAVSAGSTRRLYDYDAVRTVRPFSEIRVPPDMRVVLSYTHYASLTRALFPGEASSRVGTGVLPNIYHVPQVLANGVWKSDYQVASGEVIEAVRLSGEGVYHALMSTPANSQNHVELIGIVIVWFVPE